MAKLPTEGASALASSDLIIEIIPFFICRYRGSAAQLQAEGLIPTGFKWPGHSSTACFEDARFKYRVESAKPPGAKGTRRAWFGCDYWVVDVTVKGQRISHVACRIQEKIRELAELYQHGSPEWEARFNKVLAAGRDDVYQKFRANTLGSMVPRGRGRPAKTAAATQSKGATA